MYEHVYYRKKDGTSTSIIVEKKDVYEHVYYRRKDVRSRKDLRARLLSYRKRCTSTSIMVKKTWEDVYYRKKDVRARLLS